MRDRAAVSILLAKGWHSDGKMLRGGAVATREYTGCGKVWMTHVLTVGAEARVEPLCPIVPVDCFHRHLPTPALYSATGATAIHGHVCARRSVLEVCGTWLPAAHLPDVRHSAAWIVRLQHHNLLPVVIKQHYLRQRHR